MHGKLTATRRLAPARYGPRSFGALGRVVAVCGLVLVSAPSTFPGLGATRQEAMTMPDARALETMAARFVPTEIAADLSGLPEPELRALAKMLRAASVMDALFLRQVWAGNEAMLLQLLGDGSPLGRARLHYFLINKGPWSRLDHNAPFVPGAPPKPESANFYPPGSSKALVEQAIEALEPKERGAARGFFTTIRKQGDRLAPVPYSVEYHDQLALASEYLREAAELTQEPTLKAFLTKRADAFLTNDYYPSDVAWMELDSSIEPAIGPYEVYEDRWFNFKAAFEAFITIRDEEETKKLTRFGTELQDIENHLPIDPKYRNPKLGALAPIRVVNEIMASGDGNRAVQAAAFNLPNDERVVKEKGSKRVMLKNVQEAKFQKILMPIAAVALSAAARDQVSFEAFFTHMLMHELMHGLGPHQIDVAGRGTTVRQELKETYSTIEEAKADISGLWSLQYLIDKGVLDRGLARSMYTTFLASAFRSIRFGINEAHGRGIAIQLNALLDAGAVRTNPDGTFAVEDEKVKRAVESLTGRIMTLQARGSYAEAKKLYDQLGIIRPEVQKVLDRLRDVPVDIEPLFTTAKELLARY